MQYPPGVQHSHDGSAMEIMKPHVVAPAAWQMPEPLGVSTTNPGDAGRTCEANEGMVEHLKEQGPCYLCSTWIINIITFISKEPDLKLHLPPFFPLHNGLSEAWHPNFWTINCIRKLIQSIRITESIMIPSQLPLMIRRTGLFLPKKNATTVFGIGPSFLA